MLLTALAKHSFYHIHLRLIKNEHESIFNSKKIFYISTFLTNVGYQNKLKESSNGKVFHLFVQPFRLIFISMYYFP